MIISEKLIIAQILLPDFAADGALGTAANTVDKASGFVITQTTPGITINSIPPPTISHPGQELMITNSGSSTASINVLGRNIRLQASIKFRWTGAAWAPEIGFDETPLTFFISQPLVIGDNIIVHNFGLTAPFKSLMTQVRNDADGSQVTARISNYDINQIRINVVASVAMANIFIIAKK